MALYDDEPKVSETPATLVNDNLENYTKEEEIEEQNTPRWIQIGEGYINGDFISIKDVGRIWGKLSANPANFGFIKQEFVDSLPVDGVSKVLYLLKVYDKEVLVGYRPYFWNQENLAFERLTNNNIPNYRAKKGEHKQANKTAIEVTEPKVTDPLFNKINLGIKLGDIKLPQPEIPDGGTKLYYHRVTFSTSLASITMAFVTTGNTAIKRLDAGGGTYIYGTTEGLVSISPSLKSNSKIVLPLAKRQVVSNVIYDGISGFYNLTDSQELSFTSTEVTDVVTEL